jgi:hypothetical protein
MKITLSRVGLIALFVSLSACNQADDNATVKQAQDANTDPTTLTESEPEKSIPEMTVFKSPTCGCCGAWVDHLQANGFAVKTIDPSQTQKVKDDLAVPGDLRSCHTGVIDGYVIEGHVPAESIQKLLAERPAVSGLAVPGMPLGSPGMEHPKPEHYQVMAYMADGSQVVYAEFGPEDAAIPKDATHHDH